MTITLDLMTVKTSFKKSGLWLTRLNLNSYLWSLRIHECRKLSKVESAEKKVHTLRRADRSLRFDPVQYHHFRYIWLVSVNKDINYSFFEARSQGFSSCSSMVKWSKILIYYLTECITKNSKLIYKCTRNSWATPSPHWFFQ